MALDIDDVILMAVSFLLVAVLGPIALDYIFANVTTTGWNSVVVTMFKVLLPILWVIGVAIRYIPKVRGPT